MSVDITKNWSAYQVFSPSSAEGTVDQDTGISSKPTKGALRVVGGIAATSGIKGGSIYNAVWNDLVDAIEVPADTDLEYGYCYCFDGVSYYKSRKYLDNGIIGIHSDTAGFIMGLKDSVKEMYVAVSGFVLAYVDKVYKSGTPLTCTENGYLTEIRKQDKLENPEKIIATFWKPEPAETWGTEEKTVQVNGRMWVKIKLS